MFLWRGRMMVANLLIRMPRLSSNGIRMRKVDLFTCTGVLMVDAGTNPLLPIGRIVGMSISMLKGWDPGVSSLDVVVVVIVDSGCITVFLSEVGAYSLYWALRDRAC